MTEKKKNGKLILSEGVLKQLNAYSAAAGAVLLMVTPSEAAVHVFAPNTPVTVDGSKVGLDLMSQTQNDGNADFSFTGAAVTPLNQKNALVGSSTTNGVYFVNNLAKGAVIGTAGPGMAPVGVKGVLMNSVCASATHSSCHPTCQQIGTTGGQTCHSQCSVVGGQSCQWGQAKFNKGASGYIGVTFQAKDKSQHAGWLHYTGGTTLGKFSGVIDRWAYEDKTGWPIQMGSDTTVTQVDVAPSAGPNGSINPPTDVMVNVGGSQTFTFTPDAGYVVCNVLVDGRSVGKLIKSYTLKRINQPHAIMVAFAKMPYADAGPVQTVSANPTNTVTLDGSNSTDPNNGDVLKFYWEQVGGAAVELSDPYSATPTFQPPDVGIHGQDLKFKLTVSDDWGLTATSYCTVHVSFYHRPPIANAGKDQTVRGDAETVTLHGSGWSDNDTTKSYLWTQVYGPSVTLENADKPSATFKAPYVDENGATLTLQLRVTDTEGMTGTDTCNVTLAWVKLPPVVEIAAPRSVTEGTPGVELNGSGSYDDDDGIKTYQWTVLSVSGAPPVTLSGAATAVATFKAPDITGDRTSATLVFQLTVTTDHGLLASKKCTVTVTGATPLDQHRER